MERTTVQRVLVVTIVLGLGVAAMPLLLEERASATHQPADKLAIAGSAIDVMTAELTGGQSSETHTLLAGEIKTSSPTDLIFRVTAECALWTDVTTTGNDESQAIASVKLWVEVDGEVVAVAGDDSDEPGKVVFCNRDYRVATMMFEDEDATTERFLRTRTANAFNWIDLNLGSGSHTVELKAQLETEVTGTGMAKAAVGKRTLIVEPVKLANDVSI